LWPIFLVFLEFGHNFADKWLQYGTGIELAPQFLRGANIKHGYGQMSETLDAGEKIMGFDDFAFSLGDALRGERATLGKSLLDVQRDLRIKAAYIAAIENCDPSVFPNKGFIAGYVRSYGRYLKLDPDEMFNRFCVESGFEGVNADMTPSKKTKSNNKTQILKGAEVSPRFESFGAVQSESILNIISPSGIASAGVLALLIGGLGFGGWTLLNDIQRVEFAPVEQTPTTSVNTTEFVQIQDSLSDGIEAGELTATPVVGISDETVVNRLYRPQELAVPKLQPRDGPIASIDPNSVGVLRPEPTPKIIPTISESAKALTTSMPTKPMVVVETVAPIVQLYATRAAWVRVHYEDGTVLFEKILESGEYYSLPVDADQPRLRAGNSGSVYVLVDGKPFGPVGNGTAVAKQISLDYADIQQSFASADGLVLAPIEESDVNTAGSQ